MIGKQFKSSDFKRILKYVHNKEGAYAIGGNMIEKEPIAIAREFQCCQRSRIKKSAYHISLSAKPPEKLTDLQWEKIGIAYLEKMKFDENQYVIYRHTDREHEHVHIVTSRIKVTNGAVVSDSWDYLRSQKAIREIEKQFGLSSPQRLVKSDNQRSDIRKKLQNQIYQARNKSNTLEQFIANLNSLDIEVKLKHNQDGNIIGISYKTQDTSFPGYELGKNFSWKAIENKFNNSLEIDMGNYNEEFIKSENISKQKVILRDRYLYLSKKLASSSKFRNKTEKQLDIAIVLQLLTQKEPIDEIKQILTQSDTVNSFREDLPRVEFLRISRDYIEEIVCLAMIYYKKEEIIEF